MRWFETFEAIIIHNRAFQNWYGHSGSHEMLAAHGSLIKSPMYAKAIIRNTPEYGDATDYARVLTVHVSEVLPADQTSPDTR
jgi:hypothetical protein